MKKKKLLKKWKGFTLIELLVVLGILGILAAALIATIDPFEQLKKSQDANTKNLAVEFENAVIRYYTTHNALPWWTAANGGADCSNAAITGNSPSAVQLSNLTTATTGCISVLIAEGELKPGFSSAQSLSQVYITNQGGTTPPGTPTTVCFRPTSKSQQRDPNTKYSDSAGTTIPGTGTCKSTGGTTDCYWCTQ